MKRKLTAVIAIVLTLAGCASSTEHAPTSATPTENPAQAICDEFSGMTDRMADLVVGLWSDSGEPGDAEELDGMGGAFDTLSLKDDGEIGNRIATVADVLLESAPIVVSTSPQKYFDALESVQRACDSEGITINVTTWN